MTDRCLTRAQKDVVGAIRDGRPLSVPEKSVATRLVRISVLVRSADGRLRLSPEAGPRLTETERTAIEDEVAMMLHAHRDCLRNRGEWSPTVTFDCRDGYYGEAFGVMRALKVLGYGAFGASNVAGNLSSWFHAIERRVLREENHGGSNECDHCLERYGKDGSGRTR